MNYSVKKKLFYQTLAFILPFVIFSILFTSVILSLVNNRFFHKIILQDSANIIKTAASSISLYLEDAQADLENLVRVMASLKLDSRQKETALNAFLLQNQRFSNIYLISSQGGIIGFEDTDAHSQPSSHTDLLDRALSGRTAVSKVMADKNDLPYVEFYMPVFHLGQVDAILRARASLKFIWDILEDIQIGEEGQVYVMDGSNRIVAHRDIQRVLKSSKTDKPEALNAIREKGGPVEWIDADDGGASYNLGIYIPGFDWIVVLTQPRKEVYGYLYQNSYWVVLISLLIAIGSVFWGWRGSRRLLAPIQALHGQVQRISQGDLDQKVSIDREDEIGDLGNAFNEMMDSLKKHVDQEVETARTLSHTKNLATLGTVASKVSHEMGNFLFGIQMIMKGLKKEPLSPNGLNIMKTIENEIAQTRIFIRGFMDFARKPNLKFTRRSLDGLIRKIMEALHLEVDGPEADGRGIAVTIDWDPMIPPLRMDAVLMNQVFTNLFNNSLEAMAGSGKITITGKAADENLSVSVTDTGPGMDAETREKLFEPFFSTKGVLGNGLGLAIVKSNIEAHGGTIECVSEPGKGAEFLIHLPVDQKT